MYSLHQQCALHFCLLLGAHTVIITHVICLIIEWLVHLIAGITYTVVVFVHCFYPVPYTYRTLLSTNKPFCVLAVMLGEHKITHHSLARSCM